MRCTFFHKDLSQKGFTMIVKMTSMLTCPNKHFYLILSVFEKQVSLPVFSYRYAFYQVNVKKTRNWNPLLIFLNKPKYIIINKINLFNLTFLSQIAWVIQSVFRYMLHKLFSRNTSLQIFMQFFIIIFVGFFLVSFFLMFFFCLILGGWLVDMY